jgi:CheY-like chemotaxis protein
LFNQGNEKFTMKTKPLRILMIEDEAADAELIKRTLSKGGVSCQVKCVETEADFLHELQQQPPDVILSDHGFPSFDGFSALAIARERCPEVPFIFVTGAMGEEVAISSFENGATDYVLKNHISHLVPAIHRALGEAEERSFRKQLEAERDRLIMELQEALTQIKSLSGLLPICTLCKNVRDHQHGWQPLETYLQRRSDVALTHELCPDCTQKIPTAVFAGSQAFSGLARDA